MQSSCCTTFPCHRLFASVHLVCYRRCSLCLVSCRRFAAAATANAPSVPPVIFIEAFSVALPPSAPTAVATHRSASHSRHHPPPLAASPVVSLMRPPPSSHLLHRPPSSIRYECHYRATPASSSIAWLQCCRDFRPMIHSNLLHQRRSSVTSGICIVSCRSIVTAAAAANVLSMQTSVTVFWRFFLRPIHFLPDVLSFVCKGCCCQ